MLTKGQPHEKLRQFLGVPMHAGTRSSTLMSNFGDPFPPPSLRQENSHCCSPPPPILGQSGRKTSSNLARRKTNAKPKQHNSGLSFMVSPLASVNNGACRGAVNSGVQAFIASLDWSLRPGFESKSGTSQVPHSQRTHATFDQTHLAGAGRE